MEIEQIMGIKEYFEQDKYAALSGVELVDVQLGWAKACMEIKDIHFNSYNVVQGGAIFTLADLAFAAAVNSYGNLALGVQTSISYFKSATKGTLFAEAKLINLHKKLAYFHVDVTDDNGDLIAVFTATAYRKNIQLPFDNV